MMGWMHRLIVGIAFAISVTQAYAIDLPRLIGRVNDYAQVLTEAEKRTLEEHLARIETYEGHPQVVILTTRNMDGMSIEEYSIAVARAWGIGQKGKDNGLLITTFVAPGKAFRVRIEVGYGLEGVIPDATARAIYERTMRPYFRKEGQEDYMKAYMSAIKAIDALLRKESTGDPLIDKATIIQREQAVVKEAFIMGALLALIVGYVHWLGSGVVGVFAAGSIATVFHASGFTLWFMLSLGFIIGIAIHLVGRFLLENVFSGTPGGHGGYHGGGFGSGGFSGGGGSFGGGGYSGGR